MRRNRLIWYTVAMAGFITVMSVYLLDTEYWPFAIATLLYGALYLWAFGHANIDYLLRRILRVKEKSPLNQQGSETISILPQLLEN